MGSRLESSEPADRACACFGTAVRVWLCVQDTQERVWPLTQWQSWNSCCGLCEIWGGFGAVEGFVGGMEQQHCPAIRLFLISF